MHIGRAYVLPASPCTRTSSPLHAGVHKNVPVFFSNARLHIGAQATWLGYFPAATESRVERASPRTRCGIKAGSLRRRH